ncbi:histidinol-phosphate transaminase [Myroides odoratimimus]|uniref:Histidinol-phosphate aminotransferase n=1 Tax=Myroides odoratimimus CIP 101113 TaxID=883154 RepID=A0AAV3F0G7_9FLAO|nr:histidinol-phosphate transaminase [Myroides odoratimimus]EHO08053.1 histidinol-phosphate transaminase [Myroides odoratimimus CIP 101113]MCA4793533.1 histidinol-phosphate transaminase [Myroides odoratimimus]MCA4820724.1 histidinol-phosphate transaminase [Myroides odoratimimus]MCO7722673.1 histidinol-phosphate transaminase [Myroides odoratimimus]MDM1059623.1 histidinol-phosphate transaminase [Myroides odoratimimus]
MSNTKVNINELVRPNIKALSPYTSARDEYKGDIGIFLDANENPYGIVNRYPDPYQVELKKTISQIKGGNPDQLFLGNGSDEAIDLAYRIFCEPSKDKAIVFTPTYGMYEVYANINAVELITLPLDDVFQIEQGLVEPYLENPTVKLMFICSPNNPTGNLIEKETIISLLKRFKGIVIIDEAYIDFSKEASWLEELSQYGNLIILQTLSKGWGMAGLRIGMAWMSEEVLYYFNKVKSPYNLSISNQQQAIELLSDTVGFKERISLLLNEKERLIRELKTFSMTQFIYPSEANYLLVKFDKADRLYQELIDRQIVVRNRSKVVENTLRISIGTPEENNQLITALKTIDRE